MSLFWISEPSQGSFSHICSVTSISFDCLLVSKLLLWAAARGPVVTALLTHTEVACRGERVRDFYQRQEGYAACQTEEKVSRLECRGSCPGGAAGQGTCCTPLRSKRRKYTFQCTDGSSFVQEVEKVVKCGCTKCSS